MSNTPTWRNIQAPDMTSVSAMSQQATNNLVGAFDTLGKMAAQQTAVNNSVMEREKEQNTYKVMEQIRNTLTMDEY